MSNGKVMTIQLIAGLMKKTLYKMSQYFPKPYDGFGKNVKVEFELSSYTAKADLNGATGVDAPNLPLKSNLANLKAQVDKIDVDKIKTAPVDLSKLSYVVNNEVVEELVMINWLLK